ncbi:MAG: hypothetical protein CVU30_07625 [Betaproteobacteria bacterium HGW-Betaproteobacteria-3]|nr:MAG: hypothetical protein CVU30_07625 [Betaproteobacteria bacterium HGW-Betaproteobacteria-3]
MLNRRPFRLAVAVAWLALLQACIYVPRTTQVFDPECQIVANHMVLEEVQVAAIQGCSNEGCVALVVGAGVVSAASAIISGTIVVTGNIAYWFERKAYCRRLP